MQNSMKEGTTRQYFSRDREIVPYIDSHWEYLTTMPRRVTQSWHATIQKTLMKERGMVLKISLCLNRMVYAKNAFYVCFYV